MAAGAGGQHLIAGIAIIVTRLCTRAVKMRGIFATTALPMLIVDRAPPVYPPDSFA
jgi:hypothetical protein